MTMKTRYLIYLFAVLTAFSSCTEEIDMDFPEGTNNNLVVEGAITTERTQHEVRLSRSIAFDYNGAPPAEQGAVVMIYEQAPDGTYTDTLILTETESGIYKTDVVAGKINYTYHLYIKLADGNIHEASSYLPKTAILDSIVYEYSNEYEGMPMPEEAYYIYAYALEPPGEGDYYMWDLYVDDELQTDTIREKAFVSDEGVDGNYLDKFSIFFEDKDFVEEKFQSVDSVRITVTTSSITEEYFYFLTELMSETAWRNPMFENQPANISTNISNGALGFFRASAVTEVSTWLYYQQNAPGYVSQERRWE